jgi:hypothetical protein
MPSLRIVLVIFTLLPSLFARGQQQRDSVLNRIISVHAENQPVTEILEQITRKYGIYFSYDASLINASELKSIHLENTQIRDILQALFRENGFHFYEKGSHVIISENPDVPIKITPEDSSYLSPVLTFTGKIMDLVTRIPLQDVSISLQFKPIGTITNADGEFILKLPAENSQDTLIFSTVGYASQKKPVSDLTGNEQVFMKPVSIRIREIKVRAISPEEVLNNVRLRIAANYSMDYQLLNGFYRETVRQDDKYINVSEAVLEILKAPYDVELKDDKVRLLKARKSPDVQPFHWVNFKLQGGPYTITMLDVVKKMETFLDPEYQSYYKYTIHEVIWYKNHPVFVIRFRPIKDIDFPCYQGEMYVDRESYAVVFARYSFDDAGLDIAEQALIRKKPKGFKVRPQFVNYVVDFSEYEGKWHLHTAQASVGFRVKSPKDRVNSDFHSVSDLLITDVRNTELKRFPSRELFTENDIFTEMEMNYDEGFWGNYNIIKPDEDLQHAIKRLLPSPSQN